MFLQTFDTLKNQDNGTKNIFKINNEHLPWRFKTVWTLSRFQKLFPRKFIKILQGVLFKWSCKLKILNLQKQTWQQMFAGKFSEEISSRKLWLVT